MLESILTPEVVGAAQDLAVTVISATLTIGLPIIGTQLSRFIGIKIEEKHMRTLHSGVATWAENAVKRGVTRANHDAYQDLLTYLRLSLPEALRKLNPSAEVVVELANRYLSEKGKA